MELARKAVAENLRAYVLVNNRSEGRAPLTIPPEILMQHPVPHLQSLPSYEPSRTPSSSSEKSTANMSP